MSERQAGRSQPNIILILADDMGFSDLGCYGSEIHTPNLDRLATQGLRFSQMYNCARCCPSRASLFTGLQPHQAGVGHMTANLGAPGYQGFLNRSCVTIAEVLKTAGYRTLMSGKWHVGGDFYRLPDRYAVLGDERHPRPIDRGFDRYFGAAGGAANYFNPGKLALDGELVDPEPGEFYYTDAITDHALAMLAEAHGAGDPFFLHVAYTAPHWPLHALPEDIERYRGKYLRGWDAVRTARHEELKGMGLLDPKWEISPRDEQAPDWSEIRRKDWEDARMAVYAAQIDRMDQGIGRILSKLGSLGIERNTLVMFLSDNGGCAEFLAEDGVPEIPRGRTLDGRPVRWGNNPDLMPGLDDTYMSYDLPWANASDSPFRLYKHWVHEGGISTPFLVAWPGVTPAGRIVDAPAHFIDIMATCVEVAGASYPAEFNGQAITPLEGESLLAALRGDGWSRRRPLTWEHEGNAAVRLDNWKLVRKHPGPWELYEMHDDRTELHDLANRKPDKVHELAAIYEDFAGRCGVLPWDEVLRRLGARFPSLSYPGPRP